MEPVPIREGEEQKYICGMTMFGTAMGSWCDSACTLDRWERKPVPHRCKYYAEYFIEECNYE